MKILGSHLEEMTRCETSRFGAISCLVSCLPQRMLHGNVKNVLRDLKEDGGSKQSGWAGFGES